MKIALIGPTYPFRGGIAHYTTLLCKALREQNEVKFISFTRMYPKLIFPGATDKDNSENPVKVDKVDYIIDSLNPLTWLKTVKILKEYKPDKIVFPWWVAFWSPHFWTIIKLIKSKINTEIVFICHNVVEHESNFLKKLATKFVLSNGDKLITHSKRETEKLLGLIKKPKNKKIITAFHPTYADLSTRRYNKEEARQKIGLDETKNILLFFGFVREYKGLHILLEALPLVLKESEVILLIVGEFWKDKENYLIQMEKNAIKNKVILVDRYVPNEEIGIYFAASDLVVQPYLSASGSGISQIAYGFDRPVIATNVGSLPEVVEDGINGRIVEPDDAESLAKAIIESLDTETLNNFTQKAILTKEKFSWAKMAEIVVG